MLNFRMRISPPLLSLAFVLAASVSVSSASSALNLFSSPPDSQSPTQQQPPPAIQISVDRVNVGVIVTDPQNNFVPNLRREDFHLFDNDIEQPITDFATIAEPAEVLLLVEAGPAVYFLASTHIQAAHSLLEGLSPGDRIAVAKYDTTPQLMLDFTPDKSSAAAALANVRYYVGFGNLNLSKSLSTVLDWLSKTQGKKTIVLLSTGFDTSTPTEIDAALMRLQTSDVRVLALSLSGALRTPTPTAKEKKKSRKEKQEKSTDSDTQSQSAADKAAFTQQGFAEADRLLHAITDATGGRVYFPTSAQDYSAVYSQIAQLVRHEYSLAFTPPQHDAKVHTIDVRITPQSASAPASNATDPSPQQPTSQPAAATPAYRIDHRRAYVAPAP